MHKLIHYCWFGHGKKTDLIEECIETWKIFCPDYEIKEWNEENFNIHCCKYVEEAYIAKKWAFVSDYCRFWVLFHYGGIYLDTDVKLLRSLDNLPDTFVGFENEKNVASGLIRAALPNDKICELMLQSYQTDSFILSNGDLNLRTVCDRETKILEKFGFIANNKSQLICGTTIFPSDYFCPLNYSTNKLNITKNTYSIHLYGSSWHGEQEKFSNQLRLRLIKFLSPKLASQTAYFISVIKFQGFQKAVSKLKKKFLYGK